MKLYDNIQNGLFKKTLIAPPTNDDLSNCLENNISGPIIVYNNNLIAQYIYLFINNIISSFSL